MDRLLVVILLLGLFFLILIGDEWAGVSRSVDRKVASTGMVQAKGSDQFLKGKTEISYANDDLSTTTPAEAWTPYDLTSSANAIEPIHTKNGANHEVNRLHASVDSDNKTIGRNVLTLSEAIEFYSTNRKEIQPDGQRALNPYWVRLISKSIYY